MSDQSVNIKLSVNAEALHLDQTNPLKYINFSDNITSDGYDNPNDKSTFDSIADSNTLVSWRAEDNSNMGHLALITNIEFKDEPEGFFAKPPYDVGDGSWVALMGNNDTNRNLEAKYTITFDSGFRGDPLFVIDPKLQIRKSGN